MNRQQIEAIKVGDLGLYAWNKVLPVCEVGELREVLIGRNKGKAFRYVTVQGDSAKIGFIVNEEEQ